jgi:hypothetical protein
VEKYGRTGQTTDDNIIRRMRFACRIIKATNTHSEYVILTAFLRQQWLRERASMLGLYVSACLVIASSRLIKLCLKLCVQAENLKELDSLL